MPIDKDKVHDLYSKKIRVRHKRQEEVANEQMRSKKPPVPAKVDNFRKNIPVVARSRNIQPIPAPKRNIAPTEGMPAVNGQSGPELVKKAVTKGKVKTSVNPEDAAIKSVFPKLEAKPPAKKKRRRRKTKSKKNVE